MSAQTQSVFDDDRQSFTISTAPQIQTTETSLSHELGKSWLKTSSFPQTTDITAKDVENHVVVIRDVGPASMEEPQQHRQRKTEVDGTVVEIDTVSVLCELYMDENQERTVVVKLPKVLFPAHIRYGTPITLAYREDAAGFKRPSITLRRIILDDRLKKENDEMAALIDSL